MDSSEKNNEEKQKASAHFANCEELCKAVNDLFDGAEIHQKAILTLFFIQAVELVATPLIAVALILILRAR